jgi:hypothetical protein
MFYLSQKLNHHENSPNLYYLAMFLDLYHLTVFCLQTRKEKSPNLYSEEYTMQI